MVSYRLLEHLFKKSEVLSGELVSLTDRLGAGYSFYNLVGSDKSIGVWGDKTVKPISNLWLGGYLLEGVCAQIEVSTKEHSGQCHKLLVSVLAAGPQFVVRPTLFINFFTSLLLPASSQLLHPE